MNSIIVLSLSAFALMIAYHFYATKIESLWVINPDRPTPAISKNDGIDYVPSKNWLVLFGHHFASIAGVLTEIIHHNYLIGQLDWGPEQADKSYRLMRQRLVEELFFFTQKL